MILVVDSVFRGCYSCYYDYPDHVEYVKNSDINHMTSYEVKMLFYHFLQNCGLNPEKINYSKSIRDLSHSVNSYLKQNKLYSRIVFLK